MVLTGTAGTVMNTVQVSADGVDIDPDTSSATANTTVTGTFPGLFNFSAPTYTANESDGTATITVDRLGSDGTAMVDFATSDGTAVGRHGLPVPVRHADFRTGRHQSILHYPSPQ